MASVELPHNGQFQRPISMDPPAILRVLEVEACADHHHCVIAGGSITVFFPFSALVVPSWCVVPATRHRCPRQQCRPIDHAGGIKYRSYVDRCTREERLY